MAQLNVNIDHVATLRQARLGKEPLPAEAAKIVEKAGANGITIHLREDRRHIQDADVFKIKKIRKTKLNLEMGASPGIIKVALKVKPEWVTLVPEKRRELTTEGGLDAVSGRKKLGPVIKKFHKANILVSLFVDPDKKQIRTAKELDADFVEIHTGKYADARSAAEVDREFKKIKEAAFYAKELGLGVNAGHGLNYRNVRRLANLHIVEEFSIGHSIISRAVFTGLEKAVRQMIKLVRE